MTCQPGCFRISTPPARTGAPRVPGRSATLPAVAIRLALLLALAQAATGCARPANPPDATRSLPALPTHAVPATESYPPTAGIHPASTPAPTPTTPPTPMPVASLGPAPGSLLALADWLAAAWLDTIAPATVSTWLRDGGWQDKLDQMQAFDVDGDGGREWLITLYAPMPTDENPILPFGRPGVFWIVGRGGVLFEIDRRELGWEAAPTLVTVADFTGDGVYDLVTEATSCGAHTCFQSYEVISAHDGRLANVVLREQAGAGPATFINISTSDPASVDATGDGLLDFVVHGGTIGSVGAGIHRGYTEVWSWDGEHMVLAGWTWDPSNYRHHRLYDANEAYAAGNLELADQFYRQVIEDDTLEDVEAFIGEGADSRDDARLLAAFRLILLHLRMDDLAGATEWHSWLQLVFTAEPLTSAADLLFQTWQSSSGDLATACAAVTDFLAPLENPAGVVSYLGYANPEIRLEDICPMP